MFHTGEGEGGMSDTTAAAAPHEELLSALEALATSNAHVTGLLASSLGIGPSDLRALFFIARGRGEATPKRTAEFLELSTGATTSVLDRMADAGFIVRRPNPTDRRSICLALAPSGETAIERILGIFNRALDAAVSPQDAPAIAAAFRAIGDALVRVAEEELGA